MAFEGTMQIMGVTHGPVLSAAKLHCRKHCTPSHPFGETQQDMKAGSSTAYVRCSFHKAIITNDITRIQDVLRGAVQTQKRHLYLCPDRKTLYDLRCETVGPVNSHFP